MSSSSGVSLLGLSRLETRNREPFSRRLTWLRGLTSGWSERTCANWRVWSHANDALRGAVAELEAFLGADGPRLAKPGTT